jgi:hypothetical protein
MPASGARRQAEVAAVLLGIVVAGWSGPATAETAARQPAGQVADQVPDHAAEQRPDEQKTEVPEPAQVTEPVAPPGRVIRYGDDTLTVHLSGVPLSEVLDELGRQSGAEIRGTVRDPRDVTAQFEDVPLPDALHRLLGTQNFALVYADQGRLRAVKLLGGPQAVLPKVAQPKPVTATTVPAAPQVSPAAVMGILESHAPIPLSGRLAQAIGGQSAGLMQIVNEGLHNEDPGIRLEAVRTAVQALEDDPELRVALLGAMVGMEDAQLGSLLRASAGERAEEFAMHLASNARSTELRSKASRLLRELRRSQPSGG